MRVDRREAFVGRERELEALRDLLEAARSGRGGAATLSGEPGIGKTRTAAAFAGTARAGGARVLWGNSYARAGAQPFAPWLEALQPVTPVDAETPSARTTGLAPEDERLRVLERFASTLSELAATGGPLVVVLDDVHWADDSSLELLGYLGPVLAHAPIVLLATYRESELGLTHPAAQAFAELARHVPARELPLGGLDRDEVGALIEALTAEAPPPELVDAIRKETDGNPFFVTELCRSPHGGTEIPASLRHAIGARLARLAPGTRRMLSVAVAFEAPFAFDELLAVTALDEEQLLHGLDEALAAQVLRTAGAGERYEFAHAVIRHALYDELSPSRKARLHRRVADALQQVHDGSDARSAAEIAGQYARSSSLPGAAHGIPYALTAAEHARRSHAYVEAAALLDVALELAAGSTAAIRAEILCRLALTQAEALRLDEAEATVERALAELERAGSRPEAVARFLAETTLLLREAGASEAVLAPLVERGLRLLGETRDLTWARLKLVLHPVERRTSGRLRYGRWLGFDALAVALARSDGTADDYARTLAWTELEEAEVEPLLGRIRAWSSGRAKVHGLYAVGRWLLYRRDDLPGAAGVARELLRTSKRLGSVFGQAHALYLLAEISASAGRFADARTELARAAQLLARLGPDHRLRAGASNAEEYLLAFEGGDWRPLVEAYGRYAQDPSFAWPWLGPYAAALAALGSGRLGEPEEAARLLDLAVPPLRALGLGHPTYGGTLYWVVQAAWELDLRSEATALDRLARADDPHRTIALTRGRLAALTGDLDRARRELDRARDTLEAGGFRPLRAVVDYDEALALFRAGEAGAEQPLASAQAQFDALGMTWWSEQALALGARVAAGQVHPNGLTPREAEILRLLATGARNKEIAAELVVSVHTVERHLANAYTKIGVRNRAEATAYALNEHL